MLGVPLFKYLTIKANGKIVDATTIVEYSKMDTLTLYCENTSPTQINMSWVI